MQYIALVYQDQSGLDKISDRELDDTKSYLWDYENTGLKLAQLRFYEVPTTVTFP